MLKEMKVLPGFLCFFKAPCWLNKKKVHITKLVKCSGASGTGNAEQAKELPELVPLALPSADVR